MKNNIQKFLRQHRGNQREYDTSFRLFSNTEQYLQLQEELKHQRDLGNYLDELVQARLSTKNLPEGCGDGMINLEQLSTSLEVAQAEHELLQTEISGLRVLQSRMDHALIQAQAMNTDGVSKVAELEKQRRELTTAALARQQAAVLNERIRSEIASQESIIDILESQIATLQALLGEQIESLQQSQDNNSDKQHNSEQHEDNNLDVSTKHEKLDNQTSQIEQVG